LAFVLHLPLIPFFCFFSLFLFAKADSPFQHLYASHGLETLCSLGYMQISLKESPLPWLSSTSTPSDSLHAFWLQMHH
jgi:hypothetical protein